jgi:hypothetical protein
MTRGMSMKAEADDKKKSMVSFQTENLLGVVAPSLAHFTMTTYNTMN